MTQTQDTADGQHHERNPLKRVVNALRKSEGADSSSSHQGENGIGYPHHDGTTKQSDNEWHDAQDKPEKGPSPLEAQAQKPDVPPMKEQSEQYGQLTDKELSAEIPGELVSISALSEMDAGKEVTFRGRIMHHRRVGAHLTFMLLRDQVHTVQAVLSDEDGSQQEMVKWVQRLNVESIVQITGTLTRPKVPVKSATVHDLEVAINTIHLHVPATSSLSFDVYRPPESLHARTQNRILDLRRPSNQAIFRIRAKILSVWRRTLEDEGFLEIQTPKLQPAATESGAEVFKVGYFGRTAFLAQSPQLAKQMAISADLGKVFEVGPVFRAENSNTHRHLTEYTGLDLEMALQSSHYELIALLDKLMQEIFRAIQNMPELALVREVFPSDDLVWLPQALVLPFDKGIEMLRQDGVDVEMEDLSTKDEIRLGELVKEQYHTDFYVLDKFPASARPFYTQKADAEGLWTKSFDMFVRGQEICTGGQRINDPHELRESMKKAGLSEDGMEDYLAAFDNGVPPHGGAGVGLERLIMLLLNLKDVRNTTLFHRDPKSFPAKPPSLPHPEADTTKQLSERPTLEKLIANYGDSSNTSWLDERFELWYHSSGACIGFETRKKLALITGDPLCDPRQYNEVLEAFVKHLKTELKLTPIFMLVSDDVQDILSRQFGWRTFTCAEEQRLYDAADHSQDGADGQDRRRVDKEGIKISQVDLSDEFIAKADKKIQAWKDARQGKQMHMTEVRPWVDREHRKYFAAESKDGDLEALVVLAQLAPRHGWQLKWALDFPGATNGVIEVLIAEALLTATGPVTFGAAASRALQPGSKMHGVRSKFLEKTYKAVSESLGLGRKTGFREKFGVTGESVYICYPKHGVSVTDLREIVAFFED